MNEDTVVSAFDLLGNYRILKQGGKAESERSTLLRFFQDQKFKHKDGTLFTGKELGMRCAHLTLRDLYHIQSVYKDIEHRQGREKAGAHFMSSTKTYTPKDK